MKRILDWMLSPWRVTILTILAVGGGAVALTVGEGWPVNIARALLVATGSVLILDSVRTRDMRGMAEIVQMICGCIPWLVLVWSNPDEAHFARTYSTCIVVVVVAYCLSQRPIESPTSTSSPARR